MNLLWCGDGLLLLQWNLHQNVVWLYQMITFYSGGHTYGHIYKCYWLTIEIKVKWDNFVISPSGCRSDRMTFYRRWWTLLEKWCAVVMGLFFMRSILSFFGIAFISSISQSKLVCSASTFIKKKKLWQLRPCRGWTDRFSIVTWTTRSFSQNLYFNSTYSVSVGQHLLLLLWLHYWLWWLHYRIYLRCRTSTFSKS